MEPSPALERIDKVERLANLVYALLHATVPMTLRQVVDNVEGYPESDSARRQAFERDKRLLREEGIEVRTEHLGDDVWGYRIDPDDYYLPQLDLTEDERLALNLAIAAVQLDDPSGDEARLKLGGYQPSASVPMAALPSLPALPSLHEAARRRAPATFGYAGVSRTLDVYRLLFRGGFWYAVGFDHLRDALRSFRVDRIEGDVALGGAASYEVPAGFDPATSMPNAPWQMPVDDRRRARVRVDSSLAWRVRAELGEGAVAERAADGSVDFVLDVANLDTFRSWLLGLLDHAEVLEPADVRADLVAWLESVAR